MSGTVHCIKLGHDAEGLDRAPLPGPLGQRVFEHVSKAAWREWIAHQTRLINEQRLILADPKHRALLMQELEAYFFSGGPLTPTGYTPPPAA